MWGELACHKRLFNPPPQFSRLGTWCPTFLCASVCLVCVFGWRDGGWRVTSFFFFFFFCYLFYLASMLYTYFSCTYTYMYILSTRRICKKMSRTCCNFAALSGPVCIYIKQQPSTEVEPCRDVPIQCTYRSGSSSVDSCCKRDLTIHQQNYSDRSHHSSTFCSGSSSVDGSASNTRHTNVNTACSTSCHTHYPCPHKN